MTKFYQFLVKSFVIIYSYFMAHHLYFSFMWKKLIIIIVIVIRKTSRNLKPFIYQMEHHLGFIYQFMYIGMACDLIRLWRANTSTSRVENIFHDYANSHTLPKFRSSAKRLPLTAISLPQFRRLIFCTMFLGGIERSQSKIS